MFVLLEHVENGEFADSGAAEIAAAEMARVRHPEVLIYSDYLEAAKLPGVKWISRKFNLAHKIAIKAFRASRPDGNLSRAKRRRRRKKKKLEQGWVWITLRTSADY